MPVNRNALIRYRTIDLCLQNKFRKWTLEELIEACSEALYELEGIDKGISKRSIQMDIQMMRSDKLGYNAPIVIEDKKYYKYEDPNYSITKNSLSNQDLSKLTEVVALLKQFSGFNHFQDISEIVQRLEDKVYSQKTKQESVIDFEKNEHLKGLQYIDFIYQAIIQQKCIAMTYQSFNARTPNTFDFFPYLLKEYRNRWFVIGTSKKSQPIQNLALDRIIEMKLSDKEFQPSPHAAIRTIYKDVIGVSVNLNGKPELIELFFDHATAPYVITKPLHASQKLLETTEYGIVISLEVQINFELEREILGFGDRARVIKPEHLRRRIKDIHFHAVDHYNSALSLSSIRANFQQMEHRGSAVLKDIFTRKEVNKIKIVLDNYFKTQTEYVNKKVYAIRQLLREIPQLKKLLFNENILKLLKLASPNFFLTKALFFDKPPESNWYVTWHQDATINVASKIELDGYFGWTKKGEVISVCPPEDVLKNTITLRIHLDDTDEKNGCLQIIPGSHHKRLNDEEIATITQNSLPVNIDVNVGGVHLMKPLILHASSKGINQKHRRVIHLEFSAVILPEGLEWGEREDY